MTVIGIDFGNESGVVAVARQRGIDVVLNDESKHETPAIVCFGQGSNETAGADSTMMKPKTLISQIKCLIGRPFNDPELKRDLMSVPFNVTEGPDRFPLIYAQYMGVTRTFTPTQVLAMLFSSLKTIPQKTLNASVVDCCIGIPVYFTDLQRRAVMDAATIAGLHPLQLIHETTATALNYGIYKTDLPENEQLNVAFVDIGHASMQVCIAGFKKGQLKILSHSFDRCLGGRDFDEVLFKHFAAKFKEEYKINVYQNARACLRLRSGCEKLKKVLSDNPEAPLIIEGLMEEKDVRGFIKRDEFEQLSMSILERVKKPLEKALLGSGLLVENIHSVEVVGFGSRIPAITKILTDFFGKEPQRTINAIDAVAKGCALQCAILSPTFKVREFQVIESFPFSIALSWKVSAPDSKNGGLESQQSTIVFRKGNQVPSVKALTFYPSESFSVDVHYADFNEVQAAPMISTYMIRPFRSSTAKRSKLKIKVRLNMHGIVSVESATLLQEEDIKVPVVKEVILMENKEALSKISSSAPSDVDVNMQDAKAAAEGQGAEAGVNSGEKPMQMATDAKIKAPKRKVKKTKVPVIEIIFGAMSPDDLEMAVEEFEMDLQVLMREGAKDRRNELEAYVYEMMKKLNDNYGEFVTPTEKDEFMAKLQEVEDWLYDEGEDATKGAYVTKLNELKKQGDPIDLRYKENTVRGAVIDQVVRFINSVREAAMSTDPKLNHIDISDKEKVLNECIEAEAWLKEKQHQQNALPKHATPVLLSADVKKKAKALDRFCKAIVTASPDKAEPQPEAGESSKGEAAEINETSSADPRVTEKEGVPDSS